MLFDQGNDVVYICAYEAQQIPANNPQLLRVLFTHPEWSWQFDKSQPAARSPAWYQPSPLQFFLLNAAVICTQTQDRFKRPVLC